MKGLCVFLVECLVFAFCFGLVLDGGGLHFGGCLIGVRGLCGGGFEWGRLMEE